MSVQFHTLTVRDVRQETDEATTITFDVPAELLPVFQYKQGQYITVKADIEGVSHRRNYSLCSSPYFDEPLTIGVKRVSAGVMSSWLTSSVVPGDRLEVYPPMGNFTKELSAANARHYVLFGGGSGITPLLSILKSILRVEPDSVVTLVYANRNARSVMFGNVLQDLAAAHPGKLRLVHVLEEADPSAWIAGVLDDATIASVMQEWVPVPSTAEYFVCGPTGMMDNVVRVLHARGIDDHHLHREYFTLDPKPMSNAEAAAASAESDVLVPRSVTIRMYGQEHSFSVEPDETILSAAQRANLDPPYACQIGACCTCRAKLVSGKVRMDEREALSDDEIAEGYVLTCQSHPLTDNVVADYDL